MSLLSYIFPPVRTNRKMLRCPPQPHRYMLGYTPGGKCKAATRERPRQSACQRHRSSCHPPCVIASFLTLLPFPCIWHRCKTNVLTFTLPSLPMLLSLPLLGTYTSTKTTVGRDSISPHGRGQPTRSISLSFRVFRMRTRPLFPFPLPPFSFSVDIPLGSASYFSWPPYI